MPNNNAQLGASSVIEMANGTTVPLLITWGLLLRMSALDKDLYKRFSKLVTTGIAKDVLSAVTIVYCGYLCAYVSENGGTDGSLTEGEFAANLPNDINVVTNAAMELIAPKAAKAFKERSKAEQDS